jgi:hypothetical protein
MVSVSGIVGGTYLFANREVMRVVGLGPTTNTLSVLRGRDGTVAVTHGTGETVYLAQGYQLFDQDPQGLPVGATFVSPYINVRTGDLWAVQGDEVGAGAQARSWQKITTAQTTGDLGIRVDTVTTPS